MSHICLPVPKRLITQSRPFAVRVGWRCDAAVQEVVQFASVRGANLQQHPHTCLNSTSLPRR